MAAGGTRSTSSFLCADCSVCAACSWRRPSLWTASSSSAPCRLPRSICAAAGSMPHPLHLVLPELTVASTWREVHFPSPPPWISSYLSVCSEALSRYAEGTKAAAHAGAAVQPALRHVIGGCDISGRCMQVIVRIPSLTKLQPRDLDLVDGAAPDPSPLFTSDLQPLLHSCTASASLAGTAIVCERRQGRARPLVRCLPHRLLLPASPPQPSGVHESHH